jgi:hypothetical protein
MIQHLELVDTVAATGTATMAPYERAIAAYEDTALSLFALDSDSDEAKKALTDVKALRRRMKASWLSKPREAAGSCSTHHSNRATSGCPN